MRVVTVSVVVLDFVVAIGAPEPRTIGFTRCLTRRRSGKPRGATSRFTFPNSPALSSRIQHRAPIRMAP